MDKGHRTYFVVVKNGKKYKLNCEDLNRAYYFSKNNVPTAPKYSDKEPDFSEFKEL